MPQSQPRALQAPRRRTQEERSAATREKVIRAAIECIVEEGLHNTTAARLAERSGVTWGAIAHQFGDKDSVLFAVVERNAHRYQKFLDTALHATGDTLQERAETFVDVTWKHINEPSAWAYNELAVHNRANPNARIAAQQERLSTEWVKPIWNEYFGEFGIPAAKLDTVRNFTLGTLQGLSMMRLISHQRPSFRKELTALKQALVRMLGDDTPTPSHDGHPSGVAR